MLTKLDPMPDWPDLDYPDYPSGDGRCCLETP
jgi:hypothetical protein